MPRTHTFFAPIAADIAEQCIDRWIAEQEAGADPRRGVVVTARRPDRLRVTIDRADQHGHLTYDLEAEPEEGGVEITVSVVTADVRPRRAVLRDLFLEIEVQFEVAPEDQLGPNLDVDAEYLDLDAFYDELGAWLDSQVAESVEAPTGFDVPGVADEFRRRRTRLAVAGVLAVTVTLCSIAVDHVVTGHRRHVERDGIDVTGTVVGLADDEHDLRIDYEVDRVTYRAKHSIPDERYRIGQEVPLRVLPQDDLALIGDETFDDPPLDVIGAFAILSSFVLWPIVLRIAWRYAWARRRLRRGTLRVVAVHAYRPSGSGRRLVLVVEGDDPEGEVLKVTRSRLDPPSKRGISSDDLVTVAGCLLVGTHAPRYRVALTAPGVVATVTRSRIPLRRRWWRWQTQHRLLERITG